MSSKGKVRRVFPGGNTPWGFIRLHYRWDYVKRHIIKIWGRSPYLWPGQQPYAGLGFNQNIGVNRSGFLDAISIPELGLLLDGTSPHTVDPRTGITDDIVG